MGREGFPHSSDIVKKAFTLIKDASVPAGCVYMVQVTKGEDGQVTVNAAQLKVVGPMGKLSRRVAALEEVAEAANVLNAKVKRVLHFGASLSILEEPCEKLSVELVALDPRDIP